MNGSSKYTLVLYYSNTNMQSMRVRIAIHEFMSESFEWSSMSVKEIDYGKYRSMARDHGVLGTPAIVILKDGCLVKRHLGEITAIELQAMLKEL